MEYVNHGYGLGNWAGYLGFMDYFRKLGVVNHKPYDQWEAYLKSGVWSTDWFKEFVFVCRLPTKVLKDETGRLHSTTEPAVQWSDHLDNHFIQGVSFDKPLWEDLTKKKLSSMDAVKLPNVEQRTVALHTIGYDVVLKDIGAKVIDKRKLSNGKHYEVLEVDMKDDERNHIARLVKVVCPSTGKEAILRVDPSIAQTQTCAGAIAWTFGLEESKYQPMVET